MSDTAEKRQRELVTARNEMGTDQTFESVGGTWWICQGCGQATEGSVDGTTPRRHECEEG